jgi:hypothetical protein
MDSVKTRRGLENEFIMYVNLVSLRCLRPALITDAQNNGVACTVQARTLSLKLRHFYV